MSSAQERREDTLLAVLAHLGPMTSRDLWDHMWGPGGLSVADSKRIFGWAPDDPSRSMRLLADAGRVVEVSRNRHRFNEITWRAV